MANVKKIVETRTVEEPEGEEEDENEELRNANPDVSIFDFSPTERVKIDRIRVYRREPDEGFLGEIEETANEETIGARWGGGVFKVEARGSGGAIIRSKTIRIAGDPIFMSSVAESRWLRANGIKTPAAAPANHQGDGMGIRDMLLLMEERDAKREQAAAEREAKERREREEREERRMRDERDREERRQKDEAEREERRLRLAREDDERRAKQHREDLDRAQAESARLIQQQNAMFTQTLTMLKVEQSQTVATNPVEMLLKGIAVARQLAPGDGEGAGPPDLVTTLMNNAPGIIGAIRGAAHDAREEAAAEGPPPGNTVDTGDGIVIKGKSARVLRSLAAKMAENGHDPDKAIEMAAHIYINATKNAKQQKAAKKASPPTSSGAAAAPGKPAQRRRKPLKAARPSNAKKLPARAPASAAAEASPS